MMIVVYLFVIYGTKPSLSMEDEKQWLTKGDVVGKPMQCSYFAVLEQGDDWRVGA